MQFKHVKMSLHRRAKFCWHLHGTLLFIYVLAYQLYALEASELKVAAFNVQVFGQTKVAKPDVVDILVKIIKRYDVILIQEIRDKSGEAIKTLLGEVNKYGSHYEMVVSERLGRTTSKEQYAFLYRSSKVSVKDTYQYMDPLDEFEREPFAVLLHILGADVSDLALVGIHTAPNDVVDELNHMVTVHAAIQNDWDIKDVIIMGDFNADCSYLNNAEKKLSLLRGEMFHWWIDDDEDTTVKSTACAYDRFVMTGPKLIASVVKGSARVFHFDEEYGLDQTFAASVSDHYPIEISLRHDVFSGGLTSSAPNPTTGGVVGFFKNIYKLFKRYSKPEL